MMLQKKLNMLFKSAWVTILNQTGYDFNKGV